MLCKQCRAIHFHRISPGSSDSLYYILHWSKESFLESIAENCRFCIFISAHLDVNQESRPYNSEPGYTLDAFIILRRTWLLEWVAREGSAELFTSEPIFLLSKLGSFYIDVISTLPERYRIDTAWPYSREVVRDSGSYTNHGQPLDTGGSVSTCVYHSMVSFDDSTGSIANLHLAKQWLTDCIANHATCKAQAQSLGNGLLPTRLINIKDPHKPFLDIMTRGDQLVQYCALSYRWGEGKRLTTTKANYSAFRTVIPSKDMPKTFQDGIYACYMLGLHFIWIDALCIIQDDLNDLAKEIAVMGGVYRNALLTLAATGAASSSHGLFSRRDPRCSRPCVLPMSATAEGPTVSGELTVTRSAGGRNYLEGRGWVLQEAVLSSRSLEFGTSMLSWNCTSSFATESRPDPRSANAVTCSLGPDIPNMRLWLYHRDMMIEKTPERDSWHRLNQYDAWYKIVEDFTTRKLTVHTDSLPALAGIAQIFSESHQASYLAGLWKEDLQIGLGWYLGTDNTHKSQINVPSAPSWTWVSVGQNKVYFRGWEANLVQLSDAGAQVLDGTCEPVHPLTPFGEVTCGKLTLRAPLKRGLLKWDWQYYNKRGGSGGSEILGRWVERPLYPMLVVDPETNKPIGEGALDMQFHPDLPAPSNFFLPDHQEYSNLSLDMEVWCLLLQVRERYGEWHLTCLLLTPTGRQTHEYKRIGLLFIGDTSWFGDYSRIWLGDAETTWKYKAQDYKWSPFLWLKEPVTVTII